jgi:hypothetical protein
MNIKTMTHKEKEREEEKRRSDSDGFLQNLVNSSRSFRFSSFLRPKELFLFDRNRLFHLLSLPDSSNPLLSPFLLVPSFPPPYEGGKEEVRREEEGG